MSETLNQSSTPYILEYEYEHPISHTAEVARSITQFNNTDIKSTSRSSSLNPQNIVWKVDESCSRKPDYKRLDIWIDRAHALPGLHGGAPGPPLINNFNPFNSEIAVSVARMSKHFTIDDDSPTIGSRLCGPTTSILQEDNNPSESCIALDVMRYATATNKAENRDEQLMHQQDTSSPRPLEKYSLPQESAALNQVAHVELLKPVPAATEALKSVMSGVGCKDTEEEVNSEVMVVEAQGPRLWWSALRLYASFYKYLYKTLCRPVPQMRFFLQFGIGLRTPVVNYSGEFIHTNVSNVPIFSYSSRSILSVRLLGRAEE